MNREAGPADALDEAVVRLIGKPQYVSDLGITANALSVRAMCAAVENAGPVHWNEAEASAVLGAPYTPATMLAAWGRPELWEPGQSEPLRALQAHFDLKDLLGYPASVAVSNSLIFYAPVKIGDRLRTQQVVRDIGDIKDTKLGRGRFWTVEMQYLDEAGDLVGVERYEFFGFRKDAP
ncbi:MaoC family dehydratase N-terminal domain-containing protein [Sphingosinicella sp.]|uniref:FAS1-like dehydratase domain-containing protein n=1 Tax=Sphingosinicella sp. TaxID=1917971 RepID=UPI0035B3A087